MSADEAMSGLMQRADLTAFTDRIDQHFRDATRLIIEAAAAQRSEEQGHCDSARGIGDDHCDADGRDELSDERRPL